MPTTIKTLWKPKRKEKDWNDDYERRNDDARRGKQEEVLNSRNWWIALHWCKHCIALRCTVHCKLCNVYCSGTNCVLHCTALHGTAVNIWLQCSVANIKRCARVAEWEPWLASYLRRAPSSLLWWHQWYVYKFDDDDIQDKVECAMLLFIIGDIQNQFYKNINPISCS